MSLALNDIPGNLDLVEQIEKSTTRMITQAVYDYSLDAADIFEAEQDLAGDIGEDITRDALDKMGVSKIDVRLYGKIDYKRARYIFHPVYSCRQALFGNSKAERTSGSATATIQTAQTSMRIRHIRGGHMQDVAGTLPTTIHRGDDLYLVTNIFVKYNYDVLARDSGSFNKLHSITVAVLPNGLLQERYNPDARTTFWMAGRNAPTRGEQFRARISFSRFKAMANWRVQSIYLGPQRSFVWAD